MRRVMLFVLLGLGLPTAALATTINFEANAGPGSSASRPSTGPITLTFVGSGANIGTTIELTVNVNSPAGNATCSGGNTTCLFTGTVTVTSSSAPGGMFTANLIDGSMMKANQNALSSLSATVVAGGVVGSGSTLEFSGFNINLNTLNGTARFALNEVQTPPIPEPGTLGLLGTGLIGLAGMARRKLKLWT